VDLTGIDLSEPMLRVLERKGKNGGRIPVAVADATRLPFADDEFGSAAACHVLHLIPAWRDVVAELARVIRPGGSFFIDMGGGPRGEWRAIFRRVGVAVGRPQPQVGLTDPKELDAELAAHGATVEILPAVLMRKHRPLSDALDELSKRIHAWTWQVPADTMQNAVASARAWASEQFGDLDRPRDVETVITWRAYHF
jgi:SAM-dependent methyltransferase